MEALLVPRDRSARFPHLKDLLPNKQSFHPVVEGHRATTRDIPGTRRVVTTNAIVYNGKLYTSHEEPHAHIAGSSVSSWSRL